MALNALKNTADIILDVLKYFKIKKKYWILKYFFKYAAVSSFDFFNENH